MRRTVFCLALATIISGCRNASGPASGPDRDESILRLGSIVQTVRIDPARPASGETIAVRSVLRNVGPLPVDVESRMCGLDYSGSLDLEWPEGLVKCAAYSMQGPLAPGDSLVVVDWMRIASAPGRYTLRVRHALQPRGAAFVAIDVRAP